VTETERERELAALLPILAGLSWTFAKTYAAYAPHEYVVRGRTVDAATYTRVVAAIRAYGERGTYGPYRNKYLVIGEFKYWSMGVVINRDTVLRPEDWPETR
jgi:hypothetical protein